MKTVDCVICGYTKGEGAREKYFGALVLGCYEDDKLRYIGRVGTGFDESDLKALKEKLDNLSKRDMPRIKMIINIRQNETVLKEFYFSYDLSLPSGCQQVQKDKGMTPLPQ